MVGEMVLVHVKAAGLLQELQLSKDEGPWENPENEAIVSVGWF